MLNIQSESGKSDHIAVNEYVLKEGEPWNIRVTFKVYNEIVLGLQLCFVCKKNLIPTIKQEMLVGNYAPTIQSHVVALEEQVTPEGFFARGSYKGNARFIDVEGIVHMQYGFKFEISSHW